MLLCPLYAGAAGTIPVRLVGGRLCARCTLSVEDERITAQFIVNLGGAYDVLLDQNGASMLELASNSTVALDFQGRARLSNLPYRRIDLSSIQNFTSDYAEELQEIPVWGLIGREAFGQACLRLDIQKGTLTFGPMESPDDTWLAIAYSDESGRYRCPIEPMDEYVLRAGFSTATYETSIDAICAMLADRPGGDFDRCMVGPLDLRQVTAIRPVEGLSERITDCEAMIGNSVWQNFIVQIDPEQRMIWLSRKDKLLSDLNEQQYYVAYADQDMEGVEQYIKDHPQSRLAEEAALTLLNHHLAGPTATAETVTRSIQYLRRAIPPKDAAAKLMVASDNLDRGSEDQIERINLLLEQAEQCAQQTTDAALLGRDIHMRRGRLALEQGNLKQAHLHLLSALFGQPDNPNYNYWMGRYYEVKQQYIRAWSRYLKASLGDKAVAEAMAALERLTNDPNLRRDFTMVDAQDFLEGHIPAYSPADFDKLWRHDPNTLVEAFMCVDNFDTAYVNLALRAMATEGVHVLCYHINTPEFDPLTNPSTVAAAKRLGIEETPTVLINGKPIELDANDMAGAGEVLAALDRADVEPGPRALKLDIQTDPNGRYRIATSWPQSLQAQVDHADAYWVEPTVLLNSANQCWLHGCVVRGGTDPNALQRDTGRLSVTLDPQAIRTSHEAFAHSIEAEQGITYRTIPSYIDIGRSRIVVKLYDKTGNLVAVGTADL